MLGRATSVRIGTIWLGPVLSPAQIKKLLKRQDLTDAEAELIRDGLAPLAELIVDLCLMDSDPQIRMATPATQNFADRPKPKYPFPPNGGMRE